MSLLAAAGLLVLALRLGRWPRRERTVAPAERLDDVSIVVPARDEAAALPVLLASLQPFVARGCEVVVVDDHSTDATAAIAREYGARVVSAEARPGGWTGKNWACWTGAQSTARAFVLFTDADTRHLPGGLFAARARMADVDLLSCLPYHRTEALWERCMGPFHLLLLVATAALQRPREGRLFAIGQYLLFRRSFYDALGGHGAIREELADDLALARRTLHLGGRYHLLTSARLFDVRMYAAFGEFVLGWRRNLRLGMRASSPMPTVEIALVLAAFAAFGSGRAPDVALSLAAVALVALRQGRLGAFPGWSVLGLPLALGVFCAVSVMAAVDRGVGRPVTWKGREYPTAG